MNDERTGEHDGVPSRPAEAGHYERVGPAEAGNCEPRNVARGATPHEGKCRPDGDTLVTVRFPTLGNVECCKSGDIWGKDEEERMKDEG